MSRTERSHPSPLALAGIVGAGVIAGIVPAPASAADYDMDCKVILCMPAGFPSGCGDALIT